MYFTYDDTTVQIGQSKATVLAHSIHAGGLAPIVTWELMYPRYIHSELMTHRMFSRNAASSRATPTAVLVDEAAKNPVFFDSLTTNQHGMVGADELSAEDAALFEAEWQDLAKYVARTVLDWKTRFNLSKQVVNRALEPFLPIRTIVTATELDNFFKLRLASDAQPEIQSLAKAMHASMKASKPEELRDYAWHVPYKGLLQGGCKDEGDLVIRSVAACARVSVMRGDGKATSLEEDTAFVRRLYESGHMSPFEHVAMCLPLHYDDGMCQCSGWSDNFYLWKSARSLLLKSSKQEGLFNRIVEA